MALKWLVILSIPLIVSGYRECPKECLCALDLKGRIETVCNKGDMTSIPVETMDPNVEVIIVRGPRNHISIGPIFRRLQHLEILRVTDSNVPSVGTYSFWGVPSLRILDLSRNNITTLSQDNFKGQEHLYELDLSHNKLTILISWVFDKLKDLRRLNLANNQIEELALRVFYMLLKLKYLDLSENPLKELPPDVFKDIPELKELRCRNCLLTEINPSVFQLIPRLTELDLGGNYLKYIDEGDFKDLKRLKKLYLDGNQLSVIVNNLFPTQKSLELLDLSHNRLTKITSDAFVPLSNLTALDLSYNKLPKLLPATVVPLRKLQTLNISGNTQIDLFEIKQTFNVLHRLTALSIADMNAIPVDLLYSFDELKVLNLSGNHLLNTSLTLLDSVRSLELLDLSRNHLTGFDDVRVAKLQQIKDVKLENNPLICDRCHMGVLIDIARTLHWNIYPICYLPETLNGQPISNLNESALDACIDFDDRRYGAASISENILLMKGNMNLFAIVCAIAFITVAIIVLIAILSISRHSAKYYTNEEKRCDSSYEKNLDTLSITGNELSFKFPIDDIIYTIDEMTLHHTMPTQTPAPPLTSSFLSKTG